MELQTLVEEDETINQSPLEQETQFSFSLDHSTQWGNHVVLDTSTVAEAHNDEEALNRNSIRDSLLSDSSTSNNRVSTFNVSAVCEAILL